MQEVLRALADAVRAGDKAGRAQLMSLLLRLFFFEELPPEAVNALLPLFQAREGLVTAAAVCAAEASCSRGNQAVLLCPLHAAVRHTQG